MSPTKHLFRIKVLFLSWKKLPSFKQWQKLPRVLCLKEKVFLSILLLFFFGSFIYLLSFIYHNKTTLVPASGGTFTEGIVGKVTTINPLYAISDAERDLVELLFAGLMKYDEKGNIVPELISHYQTRENQKIYEVTLKDNIHWSDGKEITADDIIFTIKVLQNPAYKSPYLPNWLDIRVEKMAENKVRFLLKNPYLPFPELLTFKLIPKHIWQEVPAENFPLAQYNLEPVGSGPYKIEDIQKDSLGNITKIILKRNNYYLQKPYLEKVILYFFANEQELARAIFDKEIQGFSSLTLSPLGSFQTKTILMPRYFALFFNSSQNEILTQKNVRQALALAIDKEELLVQTFGFLQGVTVDSPILPDFYGFQRPEKKYDKNTEQAIKLLEDAGFNQFNEAGIREKIVKETVEFEFRSDLKEGASGEEVRELQKCLAQDPFVYPEGEITGLFGPLTKEAVKRFQEKYSQEILEPWGFKEGTGMVSKTTRKKLNELCARISREVQPLKLELITVNQPKLEKTAQILKTQWQAIGIDVTVKTLPLAELEKEYLKPRRFEILLFGQVLGMIPDLFPFWHSSQKADPGLNLSQWENKQADKLMVEARESQNWQNLAEKYQELQEILLEDCPAVFLYNPYYIYSLSPAIKGFAVEKIADPSKRFSNIADWYLKTKRTWHQKCNSHFL